MPPTEGVMWLCGQHLLQDDVLEGSKSFGWQSLQAGQQLAVHRPGVLQEQQLSQEG